MAKNCLVCGIIEGRIPSKKIYEDDAALAVLDVNGSNPGHCFVMPKAHYSIFEQIPDSEVGKLFTISNKISSAIFDALKVHGTNLFIANGIPAGQTVAHFMINIIPRKENDGINLQWQPKQLSEEEMSTVELKIREQMDKVGVPHSQAKKQAQKKPLAEDSSEESREYFMRQLTRIP